MTAVQSLGTVVPGRPYSVTVQGNLTAGGVFIAQGEVVIALNQAPVASNQSVSTPEDTSLVITLSATDADANPLTYSVVSDPTHGTLSGTAPTLTYTPSAGYVGQDSFTFRAYDGQAYSNVATVSITVTQVTRTVTFVAGAGGTLTGTTSQTVNLHDNTTPVTAEPNPGYHFVNWTGDGRFLLDVETR